jgi:hypothetical protein
VELLYSIPSRLLQITSDKYPQIDLGSPLQLLDAAVFEDVISIFITSAILKFIQGMAQMPILY